MMLHVFPFRPLRLDSVGSNRRPQLKHVNNFLIGRSITQLQAQTSVLIHRVCNTKRQVGSVGFAHFAGDLPEAEQKLIYATQGAPVADLFNQKVEGTAWKSKPSWYVLATEDQTVHPDLQRSVSKRMKATTTEVTASHVPMLSKPDVVLDVIRRAAGAVSMS